MFNLTWIFKAYLVGALALGNLALLDPQGIITVSPVGETADEIILNSLQSTAAISISDADDPAIYLHPQDLSQSLVIATFKKGGLRVYDLMGKQIQSISPKNIRYNNVDIAYGVKYQSQMVGETASVDLAITSDRINDTLAIFEINPDGSFPPGTDLSSPLRKITSVSVPDSIFGVDDKEATAYGLTAYKSDNDDKTYVFVSQSDANQIAQLEILPSLGAADELTVKAKLVRTFAVPIPQGLDIKDALVEGMVVDKETDMLYLAQENFGIWQVDLQAIEDSVNDPNNTVDLVNRIKPDSPLSADIEGLTIYYGGDRQKYLIASSQGDSTFAVYDLAKDRSYVGSFAIAGVKQTDGIDITSVPLGEQYPAGLLVVQDGVNKVPEESSEPSGDNTQYLKTNFKFVSVKDIFDNLKI